MNILLIFLASLSIYFSLENNENNVMIELDNTKNGDFAQEDQNLPINQDDDVDGKELQMNEPDDERDFHRRHKRSNPWTWRRNRFPFRRRFFRRPFPFRRRRWMPEWRERPAVLGSLSFNLLKLTNDARAAQGLLYLCLNVKLNQVAEQQSMMQARLGRMTHDSIDGASLGDRTNKVGFRWSSVAENVAVGQANEYHVTRDWLNSPGHRKNMMGNYKYFGGARYGAYWTQNFATSMTFEPCANE